MYYIVGLGNPGEEYEYTRHNAGRLLVVSLIASERLPAAVNSAKLGGLLSEGVLFGEEVKILLPNTFMNQSGTVVRKLCPTDEFERLIVVYDDVDIPLGEIKISYDRGNGGHNGLKSIVDSIGSQEFIRLRIGIAAKGMTEAAVRPSGDKLGKYVLGKFTKRELEELKETEPLFKQALKAILSKGHQAAMNEIN